MGLSMTGQVRSVLRFRCEVIIWVGLCSEPFLVSVPIGRRVHNYYVSEYHDQKDQSGSKSIVVLCLACISIIFQLSSNFIIHSFKSKKNSFRFYEKL